MLANDSAHAYPIDGWGGGPGPLPPSEVKALHATIAHVYCHAILFSLSTSAHIGRMAYVHAWPLWGVGDGLWQIPPRTPSAVKPRYITPVSHMCPSKKSWVNKQAELADESLPFLPVQYIPVTKDYKGGYRLARKIKDRGFETDLYTKHWCTHTLCTVQYRHTCWIECCKVKFLRLISRGLSNEVYNLNI